MWTCMMNVSKLDHLLHHIRNRLSRRLRYSGAGRCVGKLIVFIPPTYSEWVIYWTTGLHCIPNGKAVQVDFG